ncbi:prohibitin family protein [Kosakonia sp. S58]|uniref:SPFH domain-containing protein n=1 Tax=unclassified Kosakonia TaxID=2632876 RepID=UPI0019085FAC|nr:MULTISPECIES: SPFH domain-containing protein [unclassified Kosakonia]MBK0079733.1 prohibitin family protein [Kosakonia sp. S57]MBK0086757.1 prohibitin family protein [Kosakonia sp. S58]
MKPNEISVVNGITGKKGLLIILTVAGVILALIIGLFSVYTVNEGERGILLRNGRVVAVAGPGMGLKIPFIESVEKITVRNEAMLYEGMSAYSRDQQPAKMTVSVNFHIPPSEVEKVYAGYRTVEDMKTRLIARQIPTQLENVFGQYTAISAVQDRARLVLDIQNELRKSVKGPVVIDTVQIENIDFSDAYEKSIEDRMKAEVAIATRRQNLETEKIQAQIAVTQAQATADSKLAAAKAESESIRLRGSAEAEAIRVKGEALKDNPSLVSLTTAERWDGKLPASMIPGGSVPFISVK